ncbi:DUF1285 domain-containing protein [Marinobacter halodurans]|uniref:DUF1285 domain-containing protein n=1 Tax=Marinobacter halodurans TaxID=2528979 RepID=A0ABY1ZPP1_9GAMM|nr:DUF1285 domain-containing protein [Marinobacter halodurans]TBW56034.1 DUF1285 domain-containing protein [Marinobacter halodurans]
MTDQTKRIEEQISEARAAFEGRPPLDKWHPELSGDIDMRILRDGTWLFQGNPLQRQAMVQLFSTILRREDDGEYYLVTPVEKWRLEVEDTPLLAHGLEASGEGREQMLTLTLNTGESLVIGPEHPLRMDHYDNGEPRPLVGIVQGLEARLVTPAYYELAEHAVASPEDDRVLGVWSDGRFFELGQV